MRHFATSDFIGTRARFQRFSDSKLFHGWIESFNLESVVVKAPTDVLIHKADRFIFHVNCTGAAGRFLADFQGMDGFEMMRSFSVPMEKGSPSVSIIDVPEARFMFKLMSQVEFEEPVENFRRMVDGWIVKIEDQAERTYTAYLSDVSDEGAGILSPQVFQRGQVVRVHLEASMRSLTIDAEVRYCVKSRLAPDMFKSGLKLREFGRLEGAIWRNFLKAA